MSRLEEIGKLYVKIYEEEIVKNNLKKERNDSLVNGDGVHNVALGDDDESICFVHITCKVCKSLLCPVYVLDCMFRKQSAKCSGLKRRINNLAKKQMLKEVSE